MGDPKERIYTNIRSENMKGRNLLGDQGVEGRRILK
jgi:hypothetical protein